VRRIIAHLTVAEKRRNNNSRAFPSRIIEDNNNKCEPKKSHGAGKEARLVKAHSMIETPYPLKSALSQPNLGSKLEKVSSFFANSHNHIKQQRAQMAAIRGGGGSNEAVDNSGGNDENDPKSVNINIRITDTMSAGSEVNLPQRGGDSTLKADTLVDGFEKSVSLPRNTKIQLKSSKSAYELGKYRMARL
jgi:TBC1 domain-containing protein 4